MENELLLLNRELITIIIKYIDSTSDSLGLVLGYKFLRNIEISGQLEESTVDKIVVNC